ncbi:MAG: 3-dehydroquinate synthase [Bacteroidales bacterium]|nr:3-dehydroquinate synthase [Bacteroidales bacterium]
MKHIDGLQQYIKENNFSQLFLLTDTNTSVHCMPLLLEKADIIADMQAVLLEIPAGEENKNLQTAENLISALSESRADRNACLLSLGGGCVTDMGGFVASVYKRGIQNINLPTTLLAMVDASVGGKTAVNHSGIKNLIGTFNFKSEVFVDTEFLFSLNEEQILEGSTEMLKTFLVCDAPSALKFIDCRPVLSDITPFINPCIMMKEQTVKADPTDTGIRRKLNFGHTLGHAVEMYYHLPHGVSVAAGMLYALDLSVRHCGFDRVKAGKIEQYIRNNYTVPDYEKDLKELYSLMLNDKKNTDGCINFVLLEDIARPCMFKMNSLL